MLFRPLTNELEFWGSSYLLFAAERGGSRTSNLGASMAEHSVFPLGTSFVCRFNAGVAATTRDCEDDGQGHEDVLPGLAVAEADEEEAAPLCQMKSWYQEFV